jgi:hypothetical protein
MLRSMYGRRHLAVLAAAALLGAAGCGDDDQSESGYREEANAICDEAERKLEELPQPSTIDDLEGYLRQGIEISKEYDRSFRALSPPAELRAQHRRAIRLSRRGERLIETLVDDLAAGEPPLKTLQRALPKLDDIARESNSLARRMKLPDCVMPLSVPGRPPEPS